MLLVHAGIEAKCVAPEPAKLGSISGAPLGWQELTLANSHEAALSVNIV